MAQAIYTKEDVEKAVAAAQQDAQWKTSVDKSLETILLSITETKNLITDIKEKKADKTEFLSYEVRLSATDKEIDNIKGAYISKENLEDFKEELFLILKPTQDQVKSNTKEISRFSRFMWALVGVGGTLQIIYLLFGPTIQDFLNLK